MAVKQIPRLMGTYIKYNTLAAMEYRSAFLITVLFMVLNNSSFILIWFFIYQKVGSSIAGYSFNDVMFLWAMVSTGFGIAAVAFGNTNHLSRLIYSGELDVYLLQPKSLLLNIISSRTEASGWGDILYGLILFFATQSIGIMSIGLFLLFSLLFAIILTALRVIIHSLTFWTGNSEELSSIFDNMFISFAIYPGSIFKGVAKILLYTLVPAGFLSFIPAQLFKEFDLQRFGFLIGVDLFIIVLALVLFKTGLKRYESGNKMSTRL